MFYNFFLISLFCSITSSYSYIYPIWTDDVTHISKSENESRTIIELVVINLLSPLANIFCHICTSFTEFFDCTTEYLDNLRKIKQDHPDSFIDKTLKLLRLKQSEPERQRESCFTYNAIFVVTISITLLLCLLLLAKKVTEYIKDDNAVFGNVLHSYMPELTTVGGGENSSIGEADDDSLGI